MLKNIYNYDQSNILKLNTDQIQRNFEKIDEIFRNFEYIKPTIEFLKDCPVLKLNGVIIANVVENINISRIDTLYVDERYYYDYNEFVVKYTEVGESS